jgi:dolichol-phosphate mannosyltransferase
MANEADSAEAFVQSALSNCSGFLETRFFAVLDNSSSDNTFDILRGLAVFTQCLEVVWSPENTCIVDAYVRGYREALAWGADWILEVDAGFSHDPAAMPTFFARMAEGNDCVFGSRFAAGGAITDTSLWRRIVSRGGSMLANVLLGTHFSDMTSGYEMFTRQALVRVLDQGIQSKAHFFQTEIKFHCRNCRVAEVPIIYRTANKTLPSGALREAFVQLWRLFLRRLQRQPADT